MSDKKKKEEDKKPKDDYKIHLDPMEWEAATEQIKKEKEKK